MRKYLQNIALFFSAFLIMLFLICPPLRYDPNAYLASCTDKLDRLSNSQKIKAQRLIILGGSGAAFSTNSELIGKELSLYPINMGLHGGLGLRWDLESALPYIRKGDLIVIREEYAKFTMSYDRNSPNKYVYATYMMDSRCYSGSNIKRYMLLLDNYWLEYIRFFQSRIAQYQKILLLKSKVKVKMKRLWEIRCLKAFHPSPNYSRLYFSSSGDINTNRTRSVTLKEMKTPRIFERWNPTSLKKSINLINHFADCCNKKGAKVVLMYPLIAWKAQSTNQKQKHLKNLHELNAYLRKHLRLEILNTPWSALAPPRYFFNTQYHANSLGMNIGSYLEMKALRHFAAGGKAAVEQEPPPNFLENFEQNWRKIELEVEKSRFNHNQKLSQ